MASSLDIANYIITALMVIFGLSILNWLLIFIKFRHIRIIQSRRPTTSIIIGIAGCVGLFYERIGVLYFWNISNPIGHKVPYWEVIQVIMYMFTTALIMYISAYRAFRFYYDIKFNQSLEDSKWRLFVDPLEEATNFFLKYRSKNIPKLVGILLFIIWAIFALLTTAITLHYKFTTLYHRYCILASAVIPLCVLLGLWYKFPKYDDSYGEIQNKKILYSLNQKHV